jgi:hypothetical protein
MEKVGVESSECNSEYSACVAFLHPLRPAYRTERRTISRGSARFDRRFLAAASEQLRFTDGIDRNSIFQIGPKYGQER